MPKCWYRDCDNGEQPDVLFYRFPKDPIRCEKWVTNCANDELSNMWRTNPERVACLRVCQKHFLKEFLGNTCRLVRHAVPAPYGVIFDQSSAQKFMADCAGLISTSNVQNNQPRSETQPSSAQLSPTYTSITDNPIRVTEASHQLHSQPFIETISIDNEPSHDMGLLMPVTLASNHHLITGGLAIRDNPASDFLTTSQVDNQNCSQPSDVNESGLINSSAIFGEPQAQQQQSAASAQEFLVSRLGSIQFADPRLVYDKDRKLVSIHYSNETISMLGLDVQYQHQIHVQALKHKVNYHQRKHAMIKHRYQKLKTQVNGRSREARLLKALEACKSNFNPLVFEIFKHQIKRPRSKYGNRWSDVAKSFSSSLYLRSQTAYRFLRKTVNLPSESIIKRFVEENKIPKVINDAQVTCDDVIEIGDEPDDEDIVEQDGDNESDDDDDYEEEEEYDEDDEDSRDVENEGVLEQVNFL